MRHANRPPPSAVPAPASIKHPTSFPERVPRREVDHLACRPELAINSTCEGFKGCCHAVAKCPRCGRNIGSDPPNFADLVGFGTDATNQPGPDASCV